MKYMNNAKEYYNQTSHDYVQKWEALEQKPNNPSHYYRKALIEDVLRMGNIKRGERVIEIGSGTGLILREVCQRTDWVFGTDVSLEMLKRSAESVLKGYTVKIVDDFSIIDKYAPNEIWLTVNDFLDLKLPKNYFDKIFSIEVLRYIDKINVCFRNLKSIIKKESLFVFTVTNFWSFSFFPIKFFLRRKMGLVGKDELQQYFITEGIIRKMLKNAGYEIAGFTRFGFLTANPLVRKFIKGPRIFDFLAKIDKYLANLPIFRNFFDTFIISIRETL